MFERLQFFPGLTEYWPFSTPLRPHQDEGLFVVWLQPGGEVIQPPLNISSPDHREGAPSGEIVHVQVSNSLHNIQSSFLINTDLPIVIVLKMHYYKH
jgi:hypothetical protein